MTHQQQASDQKNILSNNTVFLVQQKPIENEHILPPDEALRKLLEQFL